MVCDSQTRTHKRRCNGIGDCWQLLVCTCGFVHVCVCVWCCCCWCRVLPLPCALCMCVFVWLHMILNDMDLSKITEIYELKVVGFRFCCVQTNAFSNFRLKPIMSSIFWIQNKRRKKNDEERITSIVLHCIEYSRLLLGTTEFFYSP